MNKNKSWIAVAALTVGLAGFYPSYVFLAGQTVFKHQDIGMKITDALSAGIYFKETAKGKISLRDALEQAPRIAAARGLPLDAIEKAVLSRIEFPTLTLLGNRWVDAADLNRTLDRFSQRP